VLVVSSVMEGGANVICEAARIGTPVIASRVPGNAGMLGTAYPGDYRLLDERALGRLIAKSLERTFYGRLLRSTAGRGRLFAPAVERKALIRGIRLV